ncbi:ketopantoate reductase family protein [uncultured Enterovirga sp.]|uniref:ketopantoate reductase family protein n=1 Tax=uncultured Enterovirga sp. TaxID=2026352 RepID=UPI0035C9F928
MTAPIVIWGAGAIGGTIGAHLVRAGHEVLFVDVVVEHVEAIASGRLSIEGPIASFTVGASAVTPGSIAGQHGLILLCVKAHHTAEATRQLAPHLAPDGALVSCQNGLNPVEIAGIVGRERTIGAFVNFSADWLEPGRIIYGARSNLVLGELDGERTERVEAIGRILRDFEPDTDVSEDVLAILWGKTGYATLLAASALTNDTMVEFIGDPRMQPALTGLAREVLLTAVAEGVTPRGFQGYDPAAFLSGDPHAVAASIEANLVFKRRSAKKHSGYHRDLAVRRRPTDIGAQLAPVRAIARRHGISTPLLDQLVDLVRAIETGQRAIGRELADELASAAAQR